jgi:hypothetical protein
MHRLIFIEFGMLQKKSLANTLVLIFFFLKIHYLIQELTYLKDTNFTFY